MATIIEQIRAEIERLKKGYEDCGWDEFTKAAVIEDWSALLSFLDTLQDKTVDVNKYYQAGYLEGVKATNKALIAEVEKIQSKHNASVDYDIKIDTLQEQTLTDCNELQEPEVDFEKEIEEYWIATGWSKHIRLGKFKVIARYFYGLGQLNAK